MSPIGVVYSLTLRGAATRLPRPGHRRLEPCLHARVGELRRRHLIFYSQQIDKVVDKLVEDRVIVIEGDLLVAAGEEDGAGIASRYAQAMDEVRDMVTDAFFTPSLEPMKEETGFAEDFRRVVHAVATGGMGSMFTRKEVDLTRIDAKTLNADFSERTAVTRSIYPQGHLAGLFRVLEQEGLDRSRFVISVNLDDDFFKRRKVRVIPQADFVTDGIASIEASLTYGAHTESVLFAGETALTEQSAEWQSIVAGGVMKPEVDVHFDVNFGPLDGVQRPTSITSPIETVTGGVVNVNPRDLYTVMSVPIKAIDFPWATYPQVELDLLYEDTANGVRVENHYLLDQATLAQTAWQVFLLDPAKRDFTLPPDVPRGRPARRRRHVGHAAGRAGHDRRPVPARSGSSTSSARSGLFPALDRAFVDVSYADPANGVQKEQSFEFTSANAGGDADVHGRAASIRPSAAIGFKATLLFADGHSVEVPAVVHARASG